MARRRVLTDPPPPSQTSIWLGRAWKAGVVLLLIFLLFWLNRTVPAQHLPWKRLDPDLPIGAATRAQLLKVSLAPSGLCADLAAGAQVLSTSVADPKAAPGGSGAPCGWERAQLVARAGPAALAGESNMQCPLSLGVGIWMARVDELARDHLGEGVARVHHFGTYSCRRMYGRASGRWSEHAFANAWDVASFELDSGELVSVLRDWNGAGDKSDFLKASRDAACDVFRVTLSPDYNAAHADHFHLDMGPSSTCR